MVWSVTLECGLYCLNWTKLVPVLTSYYTGYESLMASIVLVLLQCLCIVLPVITLLRTELSLTLWTLSCEHAYDPSCATQSQVGHHRDSCVTTYVGIRFQSKVTGDHQVYQSYSREILGKTHLPFLNLPSSGAGCSSCFRICSFFLLKTRRNSRLTFRGRCIKINECTCVHVCVCIWTLLCMHVFTR